MVMSYFFGLRGNGNLREVARTVDVLLVRLAAGTVRDSKVTVAEKSGSTTAKIDVTPRVILFKLRSLL